MGPQPHYVLQAAAIPWRINDTGQVEILLICRNTSDRWGIPKGSIDPPLDARQTAAKESIEEAGIEGEVSAEPVGRFIYEKNRSVYLVDVFSMRVTQMLETYKEDSLRIRQWVEAGNASIRVGRPSLAKMIAAVAAEVKAHGPGTV